jgi:hypothetical protein
MTDVQVSIVHDQAGHILSVAQVANGAKAIILSGEGESVWVTTVDDAVIPELITTRRVDIERQSLVNITANRPTTPTARHVLASMLHPPNDRG